MTAATGRALLTGLVDYAGLYPPASRTMPAVVANYAAYARSADRWILGRLVVPVARFRELSEATTSTRPDAGSPWRISAIPGDDLDEAARAIGEFNASHRGIASVDSVEFRAPTPDAIEAAARTFPALSRFAEVPLAGFEAFLPALETTGTHAKIRTGGVTADAFPPTTTIAQFLAAAAGRVAFKATAGLHHPLRSCHALTYEPDAPRGTMHGFLNVFLAAVFAHAGRARELVQGILDETDPAALTLAADAIAWRDDSVTLDEVTAARRDFALSFGSCSFREPVDDLALTGLL